MKHTFGLFITSLTLALTSAISHADPLPADSIRTLLSDQRFTLTETGGKPVTAHAQAPDQLNLLYASGAKRTYGWMVKDNGELCIQKRKASCGWLKLKTPDQKGLYQWMGTKSPLGELDFNLTPRS